MTLLQQNGGLIGFDNKCDEVQGYLFSNPLSEKKFDALLGLNKSIGKAKIIGDTVSEEPEPS